MLEIENTRQLVDADDFTKEARAVLSPEFRAKE